MAGSTAIVDGRVASPAHAEQRALLVLAGARQISVRERCSAVELAYHDPDEQSRPG